MASTRNVLVILDMDKSVYNKKYYACLYYLYVYHREYLVWLSLNKDSLPKNDFCEGAYSVLSSLTRAGLAAKHYEKYFEKIAGLSIEEGESLEDDPSDEELVAYRISKLVMLLYKHFSDIYMEVLKLSNKKLIDFLRVRTIDAQKLYIIPGTNRLHFGLDMAGHLKNGSGFAHVDYMLLRSIFSKALPAVNVVLKRHTPLDAQNNYMSGTVFNQALLTFDMNRRLPETCFYDESKFLNVYGAIHHVQSGVQGSMDIYFIDDLKNVLSAVYKTFSTIDFGPDLLPAGSRFYTVNYVGGTISQESVGLVPITGMGRVDFDYQATLRHMIAACHQRGSRGECWVSDMIDLQKILDFRINLLSGRDARLFSCTSATPKSSRSSSPSPTPSPPPYSIMVGGVIPFGM